MVDRIELPASLAEVTGTDATRLMEEIRQNRAIVDSHAHFTKTPYLPYFTGEQKGCDFKLWKSAVESIQKSHHSTSVTEAIRKSLQGPASKILSNLPFDAPVTDIVQCSSNCIRRSQRPRCIMAAVLWCHPTLKRRRMCLAHQTSSYTV